MPPWKADKTMGDEMLITENGLKHDTCLHCKYHYPGKRYFYRLKAVEVTDMSGFLCTAFAAEEGIIVHMDGLVNDSVDHCEMFKKRGEK